MSNLVGILVILFIFYMNSAFGMHSAEPEILIKNDDYTISYIEENDTIEYHGYFAEDMAENIEVIHRRFDFDTVIISSNGGFAKEGFMLSNFFQREGIDVVVPKGYHCMSACAYAIMGAKNIQINGLVGFHTPYLMDIPDGISYDILLKYSEVSTTDLIKFIMSKGYTFEFAEIIIKQSSKTHYITFLDLKTLMAFKSKNPLTKANSSGKVLYYKMTQFDVAIYTHAQQKELADANRKTN